MSIEEKKDGGLDSTQENMTEEVKAAIEELKAAQAKLDELKTKAASGKESVETGTMEQEVGASSDKASTSDALIDVEAHVVESQVNSSVQEKEAPQAASVPEPAHPEAAAAAVVSGAGDEQRHQQAETASHDSQVPPPPGTAPSQGTQAPPQNQYYYQQNPQSQVVSNKDHVAAGLLAIFLGWLGIHKFYLGYNTAGFIMLAVTVLGSIFTLGIASAVVWLIGVIEGIIYLTKSQTDFERIYFFGEREWF